jgi:hypothetical protein
MQFFLDKIYPFIYADLWHLILNKISWSCWDPINNVLTIFCLWHVLFPIRSCLVIIMPIVGHMIWLVYVKVMTSKIIIVFYINYLSFTLFSMVFHLSPCFSISFEILNETKLIHHYVISNSHKIDLTFNVLSPKSILVVTIYIFFVSCLFKCKYVKLWLLVIKESIECQIFFIVPLFLNSIQQVISFFICCLVSGIVMEFK